MTDVSTKERIETSMTRQQQAYESARFAGGGEGCAGATTYPAPHLPQRRETNLVSGPSTVSLGRR